MLGTRTMSEKERTDGVSRDVLETLPMGQTLRVIAVVALGGAKINRRCGYAVV